MKLGVLTYHRVVNDGSVVQAFCLQNFLQNLWPGARVEIVDYRPRSGEVAKYRRILQRQFPFINTRTLRKMHSIHSFLDSRCLLSTRSCTTDNVEDACSFIRHQGYDAVFVGSDTVWEARSSAYAPPYPNIFYLPGSNGPSRIAFAVSADPIFPAYLQDSGRAGQIFLDVNKFDLISVRDAATREYLVDLGLEPQRIYSIPDPTILWDFSSILEGPVEGRKPTRPVAGISIGIGNRSVVQQIEQELSSEGYDIVHLSNPESIKRIMGFPFETVEQRVTLHSKLDLLVTDRFHSSIFALKLAHIPVIYVETADKWPLPNSKGRDLFRALNVEEMVWRYQGGNIPPGVVRYYLDTWQQISPDIAGAMETMRQSAAPFIHQLRTFLQPAQVLES